MLHITSFMSPVLPKHSLVHEAMFVAMEAVLEYVSGITTCTKYVSIVNLRSIAFISAGVNALLSIELFFDEAEVVTYDPEMPGVEMGLIYIAVN